MELIFNELSINPLSSDPYSANDKMEQFIETFSEARGKGFKRIRSHFQIDEIQLSQNYTVSQWAHNKKIRKEYRDLLYGAIIQPFIDESDKEIEDKYVESKYYFDKPSVECVGLASAYLYETMSISLASNNTWCNTQLIIHVKNENNFYTEIIFNVFSKESFDDKDIMCFVEHLSDLVLRETNIHPSKKERRISSHHGIKELNDFCDKLQNSPYVISMRATNWRGNKFIRKFSQDGIVEIVLIHTKMRYALLLQTTGRTCRETEEIAKILEDKYS